MLYCVAPENIPTYPKEGIRNSRAEGVSKTQTFQAKNMAKLEFPGGIIGQIPSMKRGEGYFVELHIMDDTFY